jgi:hypothetical protein
VTVARNRRSIAPEALLASLTDAANGNVDPTAQDVVPIHALLDDGCDLDLDVLPVVREFVAPTATPLKRWGAPWLLDKISARRQARVGDPAAGIDCRGQNAAVAIRPAINRPIANNAVKGLTRIQRAVTESRASDHQLGARPPAFDMDELVSGYRAGNVQWDIPRLGPPPGRLGCRVEAAILKGNGY